MLTERVVDWTREWKQQGLQEGRQQGLQEGRQQGLQEGRQQGLQQGERRLLLRQIRRRFGEAIATQSAPALERIEQLSVFEALGEELFDCADEAAWLARLWMINTSDSF